MDDELNSLEHGGDESPLKSFEDRLDGAGVEGDETVEQPSDGTCGFPEGDAIWGDY
jgi:hypothetical protein